MVGFAQPGYLPGGSLRAWRDYFPNAIVTGMDVQPDTQFVEERIKTMLCDSRNSQNVEQALGDLTFDIIIDDGSHNDDSQLYTLLNLYQRVKPGGFYVIEDVGPNASFTKEPKLVEQIVGHNGFFFSGLKGNVCVIPTQPVSNFNRENY